MRKVKSIYKYEEEGNFLKYTKPTKSEALVHFCDKIKITSHQSHAKEELFADLPMRPY